MLGGMMQSIGVGGTVEASELNFDNELYIDTVNNRVGIGTTGPDYKLEIEGDVGITTSGLYPFTISAGNQSIIKHVVAGDAYYDAPSLMHQSARGTIASPTALSKNDRISTLFGYGYSDAYTSSAKIEMIADENFAAGSSPGAITFYTTPNASTTLAERMRIDNTGNVGIGTTNPSAKLHIVGDSILIATSQSPTSSGTGVQGEISWDASYLYICTATNTWKRTALTGSY